MAKAKSNKTLSITQTGSAIGCTDLQRMNLKGLGLGKIGKTVTIKDDECTRGMIRKVSHLVKIGDSNE